MSAQSDYYEAAFWKSAEGNIYEPLQMFGHLSHERRMQLLAELPLPPLDNACVVDFGVGAWGIGCVFPALKTASVLHGVDISESALDLTRAACARDPSLKGKDLRFSQSDGYRLDIEDGSVDFLFAGEAIEHVDMPEIFVDEIYRVLRPGGKAVLTTPNASPFVYRNLGIRWCVGFEHTALMDYQSLRKLLERRFQIEIAKGFNQSLHPTLDSQLDEASAKSWVWASENDPENATGLILMVRKTDNQKLPRRCVDIVEGTQCVVEGVSQDITVSPGYMGRMIESGSILRISVPASSRIGVLVFWAHDWSGLAVVDNGEYRSELDLYHPIAGCHHLVLNELHASEIRISSNYIHNVASMASQVIFLRAVFSD